MRLKYTHSPRDKHGVARHYFRRDHIRGPLPGEPGSREYMQEYSRLLALHGREESRGMGRPQKAPKADVVQLAARIKASTDTILTPQKEECEERVAFLPGTVGWVIKEFKSSRTFQNYAAGTRKNYQLALDQMSASHIGPTMFGHLTRRGVHMYCRLINERHGGCQADLHLKLLSVLWHFADGLKECEADDDRGNPTRDIKRFYRIKTPHKPWPPHVLQRFFQAADKNLRLAMMMLLYTGQRRIDVINMKWIDYDGAHIPVVQQKTDEPVYITVHSELKKVLDAAPRVHKQILTHKWKRPYTPDSLTHRIKDVLIAIDAAKYTLHGLRKNAGVMLAEAGCTVQQIMSVLGHRSPKMALYYCAEANKKKLNAAAMAAWEQAPLVIEASAPLQVKPRKNAAVKPGAKEVAA